jgi:hypothetical protein
MDEQKLRQWAIEQAIALHGAGRTMEIILGEAERLLAWVRLSDSRYEKPKGE